MECRGGGQKHQRPGDWEQNSKDLDDQEINIRTFTGTVQEKSYIVQIYTE